jgi:alpha-methylacyl-CoA racemase
MPSKGGPLAGIRVLDLSALGPGPFASMMLADFGADVLAIRRPGKSDFDPADGMGRGKTSLTLDLRKPGAAAAVTRLANDSDVFLESFRPGVMEKRGLGPEVLMRANEKLIYVRLTGWGQTGPYAARAGHDINYLAIAGALGATGIERPLAPPALLGDLANGSYPAMIGIMLALFERQKTGCGQIVDVSIADSAAYMMSSLFNEFAKGQWNGRLGEHILSGGAPFYGTYQCADGGWFAVGAVESQFYAAMLNVLDLINIDPSPSAQWDRQRWPDLKRKIAEIFSGRTRDEWAARFETADACGVPVLDLPDLISDKHLKARRVIARNGDVLTAAPAPRLSAHDTLFQNIESSQLPISNSAALLRSRGFSQEEIRALAADETVLLTG